jgi:N-acylneuraminate cytidylyltransferase
MKEFSGLICARAGSKGLPGKNLKLLNGRPLIAHSIEIARKTPEIVDIVVSTDSEEIADIARSHGARTPFIRPDNLATDTAAEWKVWQHFLDWMEDYEQVPLAFVVLPPTAPLRQVDDVQGAIKLFQKTHADGVLCGTTAHRNPYFNMVVADQTQRCQLPFKSDKNLYRRQDAPPFFDVTTVCYVIRSAFVKSASHIFDGKIYMHEVPVERSIDIDTQFDFEFAEYQIKRREG